MTPTRTILYVNFSGVASDRMFRRRLDGIRRYAKARGAEVATLGQRDGRPEEVPQILEKLRPVGCVVEIPEMEPKYFASVPILVFDPPPNQDWSAAISVACDEKAVAEAAFRELSAGDPPIYAVVSYWQFDSRWAIERAEVFKGLCRKEGKECLSFRSRKEETPEERAARLGEWVASLPRRCAIFAVNDAIASDVSAALGASRRTMPHDATLVGANGDATDADAAMQDISSVKIDFELSGYLAAKALLAWASCHARKREVPVFGPLLVDRRKSTRGRGRRTPFVLEAVETIRRRACDGLSVAELVRRSGVSKSLFNLRFREAVGHSARDEIEHVRLDRVFTLLAETDVPIGVISDMCGFGSRIELRKIFRARTKTSMTKWRAIRRE